MRLYSLTISVSLSLSLCRILSFFVYIFLLLFVLFLLIVYHGRKRFVTLVGTHKRSLWSKSAPFHQPSADNVIIYTRRGPESLVHLYTIYIHTYMGGGKKNGQIIGLRVYVYIYYIERDLAMLYSDRLFYCHGGRWSRSVMLSPAQTPFSW